MHLYLDKSGDFSFPRQNFDAYVQAALVCPDSLVENVDHFVSNQKEEMEVDELHAKELDDEWLVDIWRFIGTGPLSVLAQVTDTKAMTDEQDRAP